MNKISFDYSNNFFRRQKQSPEIVVKTDPVRRKVSSVEWDNLKVLTLAFLLQGKEVSRYGN